MINSDFVSNKYRKHSVNVLFLQFYYLADFTIVLLHFIKKKLGRKIKSDLNFFSLSFFFHRFSFFFFLEIILRMTHFDLLNQCRFNIFSERGKKFPFSLLFTFCCLTKGKRFYLFLLLWSWKVWQSSFSGFLYLCFLICCLRCEEFEFLYGVESTNDSQGRQTLECTLPLVTKHPGPLAEKFLEKFGS